MSNRFDRTVFITTAIIAFLPTSANKWAEGLIISLSCGEAGIVTAIYKKEMPGEYGSYYYADLKAPSLSLAYKTLEPWLPCKGFLRSMKEDFHFFRKEPPLQIPRDAIGLAFQGRASIAIRSNSGSVNKHAQNKTFDQDVRNWQN